MAEDRSAPGFLLPMAALLFVLGGLLVVMWVSAFGLEALPFGLGFAVYFGVAHVYLPYRVYVDARGRGSGSATGWTALTFFLPVVGAALYVLFVRLVVSR